MNEDLAFGDGYEFPDLSDPGIARVAMPRPKRHRKPKEARTFTYGPQITFCGAAQAAVDYIAVQPPGETWHIFRHGGRWFATNKTLGEVVAEKVGVGNDKRSRMRASAIQAGWTLVAKGQGFNYDAAEKAMNAPEYAGKLIEGHIQANGIDREYRSAELIAMLQERMTIGWSTARKYLFQYTNNPDRRIESVRQGSWVWDKSPQMDFIATVEEL